MKTVMRHSLCRHQGLSRLYSGITGFMSGSDSPPEIPSQARVVICGGGIIGTSVLYHLCKYGWRDVVLLEQGRLSCGTSWHAAGLIGQVKSGLSESKLAVYSRQLYKELDDDGEPTGWKQCGSISLARTRDRLDTFPSLVTRASTLDVEAYMISPQDVQNHLPFVKIDDIEGGLLYPTDGVVSPTDIVSSFARRARQNGGKVFEGVKVEKILTKNCKVSQVQTNAGSIDCEYFINCAGFWSHNLGRDGIPGKKVRVPLHPVEHFYIVTKELEGIPPMMPVIRDMDVGTYFREWSGGLMCGGFEKVAKPVFHDKIPDEFYFQLLPEDWDHFQPMLEEMLHRIPMLVNAKLRHMTNGPESFTPDGKIIFGEVPEVNNYFVATGMNSSGIVFGGGVGKAMAEYLVEGEPSLDLLQQDVKRFLDLHNNRKFLRDRVKEVVGRQYKIQYPLMDYSTSRKLRTSPLYTKLQAAGAVFVQSCGFERPMWFDVDSDDYTDRSSFYQLDKSFGKPVWFDAVRDEYLSSREGVAMIDMSAFAKFELKSAGHEVVDFMQYLCSNNVDKPVGDLMHSGMQNHRGGYENDCSVVRLAENHYFVISPSQQQTRCMKWIKSHLPSDGSVMVTDVTSMYTAINVIGALSRDLMSELTEVSMANTDFPFFKCKVIDVGYATGIRALSISHAGELGWVLYIPNEYALHVYDRLQAVGKNYGLRHAGYLAMRSLRIEKLFAHWGQDLTPFTTPLEAGRAFRVKIHSDVDFIGKQSLLEQKKDGVCKKLIQLQISDHDVDSDIWPWGGEAIYRNGKHCGTTTSAMYGFTLNRQVCIGFVHDRDDVSGQLRPIDNDYILKDASFEVEIAGRRFPAKAGVHSPTLVSVVAPPSQYAATQAWSPT